jgi:hypothetical protein
MTIRVFLLWTAMKLLASLLLLSAPLLAHSASKWETSSCDYSDIAKEVSLSGHCHKQESTVHGNFAYVLTWPSGNKVVVEYIKSQSGNHLWLINGQRAVGTEVTREQVRGFTLDLNQLLEWQD